MICPHCQYHLGPFDLVCPKCGRKPIKETPPPTPLQVAKDAAWQKERAELRQKALERRDGKAATPPAEEVPYNWEWSSEFLSGNNASPSQDSTPSTSVIVPQPAPRSLPSVVPPRSTPAPSPSTNPAISPSGGIVCPCCQGSDIQSVSAIVRGGTWSSSSSFSSTGTISADTAGINMGSINGPHHSHAHTFGVSMAHTNGQTTQHGSHSSSGATELARTLDAPVQPPQPVKKRMNEKGVVWLLAIPGGAYCLWRNGDMSAWLAWPLIVGCLSGLWGWFSSNAQEYKSDKGMYPHDYTRWQKKWAVWSSLHYCHRCDCVFEPSTGRNAHSTNMKSLLPQ